MTARVAFTPMMSIYDGQQCISFVIARARQGHEAFDRQERSLGLFKTAAQAANAVADAAESETVSTFPSFCAARRRPLRHDF